MKVAGEVTLKAPCVVVWSVLRDPAVLGRAIPGCEWLEITGPGTARLSVRLAIAAVSGSYAGQLSVFREQYLEYIAFKASASGDQGTAAADITVRLTSAGEDATLVSYEASGLVSGPVAGVGTRLLASIARRIADDFLAAVEQHVAERSAVTSGAPSAVSGAPPVVSQAPPAVSEAPPAVSEAPPVRPAASGVRPAPAAEGPAPAAASSADAAPADGSPAHDFLPPSAAAATRRRPRMAVAFGAGLALGLGGVIAAVILGRKGGRHRAAPG